MGIDGRLRTKDSVVRECDSEWKTLSLSAGREWKRQKINT